jgi:hypothetical protein
VEAEAVALGDEQVHGDDGEGVEQGEGGDEVEPGRAAFGVEV